MSVPIRAVKSKIAESILKKNSIELFVYIEDEKLCHVYESIFHRLLDIPREQIEVTSLNSKTNSITQFEIWDKAPQSPNNTLFIVDRDFDHLLETNPNTCPESLHFLELERYTIENYLVEKNGVIQLIRTKVGKRPQEIEDHLEFDNWLESFYESFEELFILFGVAHKYKIKSNNGSHASNYIIKGGHLCNAANVDEYKISVEKFFVEKGMDFSTELHNVRYCFLSDDSLDYEKLSNGKYKLFSLLKYIKEKFNNTYDEEMSKSILAERMDLTSLTILKERYVEITRQSTSLN